MMPCEFMKPFSLRFRVKAVSLLPHVTERQIVASAVEDGGFATFLP